MFSLIAKSAEYFASLHPKFTHFILTKNPPQLFEFLAKKKVIAVFHKVVRNVPSYKKFLKENGVHYNSIRAIEDFKKLPIIDKKNYIEKYSLEDRCWGGKITDKYSIERSSGYSGKPTYWPRAAFEDREFEGYATYGLVDTYNIDKKSTLIIVTWGMGSWVTGEKFARFARRIASRRGYPASVISPGGNIEEILEIINNLGPQFNQVLLAGYPPFLKTLVDEGEKKGIDWKKIRVHILSGGEGFSETWREYVAQKLGSQPFSSIGSRNFSAYGSADAGIGGGHETPFSILVRRLAMKDRNLAKELFGNGDVLPMVFQYNPTSHYIEEINGELVFTTLSGMPIVRYNLHDNGGIRPFQTVVRILEKYGHDYQKLLNESGWPIHDITKLPFSFVFGRSDGTVILDGANIYIENIKHILYLPVFAEKITGNFIMEKITDNEMNPRIKLIIQVKSNVQTSEELENDYSNRIMTELAKNNNEYEFKYNNHRKIAIPIVKLVHSLPNSMNRIKNKYIKKQI